LEEPFVFIGIPLDEFKTQVEGGRYGSRSFGVGKLTVDAILFLPATKDIWPLY
jgi:hypothetical protein